MPTPKKAAAKSTARGQIIAKGPNKWMIRHYVGKTPEGTNKYAAKVIHGTHAQAQRELTKRLKSCDEGSFVAPTGVTLGGYLDSVLASREANGTNLEVTLMGYRGQAERYIKPSLGRMKLDSLTTPLLRDFITKLTTERKLSGTTVRHVYRLLKMILRQAVQDSLLAKNPLEAKIDLPTGKRPKGQFLTPEQTRQLLDHARTSGDSYYALWMLLLYVGLRPNEALALRWEDFSEREEDGRRVTVVAIHRALTMVQGGRYVVKEWPKTDESTRVLVIPAPVAAALESWKVEQRVRLMAAGKRTPQVFINTVGTPLNPLSAYKRWIRACEQAGVPVVKMYAARHTSATLGLLAGEDIKAVSERLGHSTILHTADTYSHVLMRTKVKAADQMERVLELTNPSMARQGP
jgi:integrase